jgi:hypothetical protein
MGTPATVVALLRTEADTVTAATTSAVTAATTIAMTVATTIAVIAATTTAEIAVEGMMTAEGTTVEGEEEARDAIREAPASTDRCHR